MVGRTFKVNCDSQTLNNSKSYGFIEDQSVWTRWKLPIIGTLRFNPIVSFFSIILIWIFVAVCIVYKENVPFTIWKAAIGQKLVLFPNSKTLSLWGLSQPETLHTTCSSILTMSMEFDKNFSNWSKYSTDHKNGLEKNFELFWSKLLDPPNCKILTFKVIFLCQKLSETF